MLISTRFGNTAQVHQVKLPGGARTQLTFFNEPIGGATFEPAAGPLLRLRQGRRRQRVRPALSLRRRRRPHHAAHRRRPLAERRRRLEHQGRPAGLRLDAAQRRRPRRLRDGPGAIRRPTSWCCRSPAAAGGARLVARRQPPAGDRVHLDHQEHAVAGRCGDRPEDALTQTRPRRSPTAGAVFSADGRGVYVTTDKDSEFQRLGYIDLATKQLTPLATDLKWDVEGFDLSQDGKTLACRSTNEDGIQAAPVRHRARQGAAVARCRPACSARWRGTRTAATWRSRWPARARPPTSTRSTRTPAGVDALDRERARRPGRLGALRAGADSLEELRRPRDLRLLLQGAGALHGQAAR